LGSSSNVKVMEAVCAAAKALQLALTIGAGTS
jgi:hypothetical protein